ncbi:MAG TPA: hypothetical protein VIX35_13810 [Vicinamibacterales bacterium]
MPKFDLAKTHALVALFATPRHRRDDAWRPRFYAAIVDASMRAFDPQVSQGPDGFFYFSLALPEAGAFTPFCVSHILDYVLDNGIGVAVFGSSGPPGEPEWVFTYGDLLSYSLYGDFDGDPAERGHQHGPGGPTVETVEEERKILVGSPSEQYYPKRALAALASFMRERLRVEQPEIKVIADPTTCPALSLAINLRPADYDGDLERLGAAMRYVGWYLPRTHALMSLP